MMRHSSDDPRQDPGPDPAALDQAALVDQFGGIDGDVIRLIGDFIDKARADLDALPAVIGTDPDQARRMAHALRGAARMAGAAAFTDALQALERCLNGADPGRTNAALAACADALQQAHRAWWGLNSSSDPTGWRRIK